MKNVSLLKYDQQLHYEWSSHVLEETEDYVLLYAGPGRTLQHHTRNACYTYDSYSHECFMRYEGFTLQLDLEQDGTMRGYSNIGLPQPLRMRRFISLIWMSTSLRDDQVTGNSSMKRSLTSTGHDTAILIHWLNKYGTPSLR